MKSLTGLITITAIAALSACGGTETTTPDTSEAPSAPTVEAPQAGSLDSVLAGAWRADAEKARDAFRNPGETLAFFGVEPDDTVIEIWPGGGWYTNILAPYLAAGDGKLIAAGFDPDAFEGERRTAIAERMETFASNYAANPDLFGTIDISAFSKISGPLAEPGSADVVLTFRNVHNWMAGGYVDKAFEDAFAALKPGGVLGVVEHRLPSTSEQDPAALNGYVHEDYVKAAAIRAGFTFEAASEVNANPKDTADHPFGVWTLPPVSRTQDLEGNTPEDFDPSVYVAIGESDRMTLKFIKPGE